MPRAVAVLVLLLSLLISPQAESQTQNCVASAVAGGTANALVIPQLPCSATSTLVLITASAANSGATTLQIVGALAVPVQKGTGVPLAAGDIPGAGFTGMFVNAGTAWKLLNPVTGGSGAPGGVTSSLQYNAGASVFGGTNLQANGVLVTNGAGAPSESQTLPGAVQANITGVGTITAGTWSGGTITPAHGGTGLTSGTAGGLLAFSAPGTLVSTGTFTSGAPILGGGSGLPTAGTVSGNTTEFATISGALISGNFTKSDASGNLVDAGTAIGNVSAGTAGQIGQYSVAGSTISGLTMIPPAGGRLTLTSGTPVLTGSVAGATTVFWSPYNGQIVPIWDGVANWKIVNCGELSNITSNSSVGSAGPAAVGANGIYDLFVWVNGSTCTLTRGPVWTNNMTRSAGLTRQNGILLNTSSVTNGPLALTGTYVGSICSNGGSTIDYIFGAAASGGTAARFCIWNQFNRVSTGTTVTDSGVAYALTSVTIRQARASAGNQIGFLLGQNEDGISGSYASRILSAATLNANLSWCLGFDSTSACGTPLTYAFTTANVSIAGGATASGVWAPGIGLHVLSANESSDGANATNTFDADRNNALYAIVRN